MLQNCILFVNPCKIIILMLFFIICARMEVKGIYTEKKNDSMGTYRVL